MPLSQVLALGIGAALSFVGIMLRLFPWALLPLMVAAVVAFKRVGIWQLHELIPLKLGWYARRRRRNWFRPVPLLTIGERASETLPPQLAGLRLYEVEAPWVATAGRLAGIGVVHDSPAGVLTAVLRVTGDGQFSLLPADAQDTRVALWGDALAVFCRERGVVSRIVWQEWSTATRLDPPSLDAGRHDSLATAAADYTDLVTRAAPKAVAHDVLLSVSVDIARVPARRQRTSDAVASGLQQLVEELRLFSVRLEAAGLDVDPPLTPAEVTAAVRRRSAPFADTQHRALGATLAAGLGVAANDLSPMAVAEEWDHARVDRSVHRSWWVEGWPRAEVPALWLDLLLLGGVCTRTVTVVFEPVAPSQSARAVDEASVALDSAEASKSKHGFRVRAGDRRAREEIERREHELVAGHGELAYCGLITVSARSIDELDDAGADFEQAAAHAGLQLRPLESRHGAGWVSSLPLGRTLAARRQR
jgi:hypothetical protein